MCIMRDEKDGRKKQARSNKQQGKVTQAHMYVDINIMRTVDINKVEASSHYM